MTRTVIALIMVAAGFTLQFVSYFALASGQPLGTPTAEGASNPRVPYAPLIFIVGVMLVFMAAVVYELLPERKQQE